MSEENSTNKWREIVEKLMAKAEDKATTQAERDAIVDKVTHLMAKFGIEQDMLRAQRNETPKVDMRRLIVHAPFSLKKMLMLNAIAKAFGCYVVRSEEKANVFGVQEDIERVFMLYFSLVIQLITAMEGAQAEKPAYVHTRTFNTSFVEGYVATVIQRVNDAAARAREDVKASAAGSGMELVLINKAQLVKHAVHDIFPRLSNIRTSTSVNSREGYNSGRAAGMRADLGGTRIGQTARREIGN